MLLRFGSLQAVLLAPSKELVLATGGDTELVAHLVTIRRAMHWTLRRRLDDRPLIKSFGALQEYLRFAQGAETTERFRILYLDTGHRLLREEVESQGTVDESAVYVREVVRRALELGASGLILVHNHPSGVAEPSNGDKGVTRALSNAARCFGIQVLDHLIVTRGGWYSFRGEGLL